MRTKCQNSRLNHDSQPVCTLSQSRAVQKFSVVNHMNHIIVRRYVILFPTNLISQKIFARNMNVKRAGDFIRALRKLRVSYTLSS